MLVQILTKAANYVEECPPHILFPNNVKDEKLIWDTIAWLSEERPKNTNLRENV